MKTVYHGYTQIHFGQIPEGLEEYETFPQLSSPVDVQNLIEKAENAESKLVNMVISGDEEQNFNRLKENVEFIQAAGGVVFNPKDDLLLIKRLGKWDLPKGKRENDESDRECAVREVTEECGIGGLEIIQSLPDTYHMYRLNDEWLLKKTTWFKMTTTDWEQAKPQTEEQIEEIRWVKYSELDVDGLETYPAIQFLLHSL